MIRVGIVGSSGYAGGELLRLLLNHPGVEIAYVASRTHAGKDVGEVIGALRGAALRFQPLDPEAMGRNCDVVFTAVPHGASMALAPDLRWAGCRLIDIGSDFRFRDAAVYEKWYGVKHTCPELAAESAYGLPELFREEIAQAAVVGNPGCYPTSVTLALAPLVKAGLIDVSCIVATSLSGASGAGAEPRQNLHLPEATENAQAYGLPGHRHTPEIEMALERFAPQKAAGARVTFAPHLVPMSRGILSTLVLAPLRETSTEELLDIYNQAYGAEPFIEVLGQSALPRTKDVWGTNRVHLTARWVGHSGRIAAQCAIDNLGKGAAGQAVQNMNLMFGLDETAGLQATAVFP